MILNLLQSQLCDIQGRLFILSGKEGLDSKIFAKTYMTGEWGVQMDSPYDFIQWAGEEYILDEIIRLANPAHGPVFDQERLYWAGYIYRYWNYLTGESSSEIYGQADMELMGKTYMGFHTLDPEKAIEELKDMCKG